jgi:DNA polymerase I-like protein with 3'-5' exonuclease and polymerase domains
MPSGFVTKSLCHFYTDSENRSHLDEFFEKCFGMYTAVRRHGLDRASKKDVTYCTSWLRDSGWRRVDKRLPDGQRVRVWRIPEGVPEDDQGTNSGRPKGSASSGEASPDPSEGVAGAAGATAKLPVAPAKLPVAAAKGRPKKGRQQPERKLKTIPKQQLTTENVRQTQTILPWEEIKSNFDLEEGIGNFYFHNVREKSCLGLPAPERLVPAALDRLEGSFPRNRFLAIDVETTGVDAARDGLRTVQISDGEAAAMLVFDRPVPAHALVVLAEFLDGRRVVAHNARFEASWLREAGIGLVLDDTALLFSAVRGSHLLKGGKVIGGASGRMSLAMLAAMVLGETLDKSEQTSDWAASVLSEAQLAYAFNDAVVTHRIWEALRAELHRKSGQHGIDIATGYEDMRFSAAMAHIMERTGIGFDATAHREWVARKQEPVAAIDAHLAALEPALTSACVASGAQLDRLFRARLESYADKDKRVASRKWPKTEKTRRLSFGREELATVLTTVDLQPDERRLVEALYARSDQVRFLATFGSSFSEHVIDGRLYGQLHAGGTVTGRYTSTDPNLQNIPTESEFREFFCASAEGGDGRVLVDVDYSQLELRVFAALSGDAKMIAAFEDGWDYHDLIVQRLGISRRQAKAVNFGIIFGMSAATLAVDLGVDDVTAGEYVRAWDEQAPDGAKWRYSLPRLYAVEQGVRTARRWIDYLDDDEAEISKNTRPMNYPVQGGAADVMHRAMRLLFERYRDWPGNAQPVLTVHDEVLVECDVDVAEQVGALLAVLMVEAFRDVFPNGPTRFLAVPGVGPTWAAAKADGEAREKVLRTAVRVG